MTRPQRDIAIAHKDYDVRGGGEVLAEELARTFDAPLHVGHRSNRCEPDNHDLDIREIPLSTLEQKAIERGGITRTATYMMRWQAANLDQYDIVITSGNEPLWWVPKGDQAVVAYTHSTPRWMYDLYHTKDFDGIRGRIDAAYNLVARSLYESNVRRPDIWVANSDVVARRIRRYWNIPEDRIRTVYPPVNVADYNPDAAATKDYYLHVGRLAGAKRVGEVIEVFNDLDHELVIAGTGPEEGRLKRLAADNIRFVGYVSEERKRELMAGAKAGINNALNEDFGMTPVEFLAAGTPMLTVREGMPEFTITDGDRAMEGVRGYSYERGDLLTAIRRFEDQGVTATDEELADFAERFSVPAFREGIRNAVAAARERAGITPSWTEDTRDQTVVGHPARADGGRE